MSTVFKTLETFLVFFPCWLTRVWVMFPAKKCDPQLYFQINLLAGLRQLKLFKHILAPKFCKSEIVKTICLKIFKLSLKI